MCFIAAMCTEFEFERDEFIPETSALSFQVKEKDPTLTRIVKHLLPLGEVAKKKLEIKQLEFDKYNTQFPFFRISFPFQTLHK